MSPLDRADEVVSRLEAVTAAALRANARPESAQQLRQLLQTLHTFKTKLNAGRSAAPAPKPGQGKSELVLVGAAALVLIAGLVFIACAQMLMEAGRRAMEESEIGGDLWDALRGLGVLMAVRWAMLQSQLRIEVERQGLEVGDPCFEHYTCVLAVLEWLAETANGAGAMRQPILAHQQEILENLELLRLCLGSLIRCLDPEDSLGWWERLVGPDGVVNTTIRRFVDWRAPDITVPRPGQPPGPPIIGP